MSVARVVSIMLSTAAFGLAASAVQAQRTAPSAPGRPAPTPSPRGNTLRCVKEGEDHAKVYNGGPAMLAKGTYVEVHAHGGTQESEGTGMGQTSGDLAVGASFVHPIKFSKNFKECEAKVAG